LKEKIKFILRIFIFTAVGIFLFWLVYKDQPVNQIIAALKDANYLFIIISLIVAFLSHISRALRWNILINSLGYYPKTANTIFAVFIMYLSNTAIPRSGEFARCGLLKKYENIPFSQLIGTVIVERVFDFLMLFIMVIVALFTQYKVIGEFIKKNPGTGEKLAFLWNINTWIIFFSIIILSVIALFIIQRKMRKFIIYIKIKEFIKNIILGIKTVKKLEKKWQFILHSVFIWSMYFISIYLVFFSFSFTSHLSILTGLTVFVMACFGMIAPSPGGIGTWHFMVIETLVIYGIQKHPDANAFAFAAHGSMTLLLVIMGLISLVLIPVYNKKKKKIA
jgi:glycosyltransferase 2 family protein